MKRVLAQANKEWKQFRRDRLSVALAALLPIVMILLFGTAFTLRLSNLPLALDDLDNTHLSRTYVETWMASIDFVMKPLPAGVRPSEALDRGLARAVLIIPPGFARDYRRGLGPQVEVLIDGTDANSATVISNMTKMLNQAFMSTSTAASGRIQFHPRLWYNPGLSDRVYFGSGAIGLVLILFPALLGALAVSREHEQGTLVQVYASSLTAPQWLAGKALTNILIGLVEFAMCFVVGLLLFQYRIPSNPVPALVATLLYITAGTLYGMAVGNATGTQSAAIQAVQLGAFLASMLLSGFLVPTANIPPALRWVSSILPATHYIKVMRNALLRDLGWQGSTASILMLAGLVLLFFGANMGRMRRMQFTD